MERAPQMASHWEQQRRSGRQKQDGEGIVAQGRKGCNVLAFYFLER